MDIVFVALGIIVVGLAGFYFWHRKEELELKGQIVKLKEEVRNCENALIPYVIRPRLYFQSRYRRQYHRNAILTR